VLLLQDQERELLQQGYETLQVLEAERISELLKAGMELWSSHPHNTYPLVRACRC